MASTRGRRVEVPLTNKSGGGVIAGDVVILDSANDDAFTTTTSAQYTGVVGIAQETIASNATGRVLLQGEAALVNVQASVTRGHYLETYSVAKQGNGNSARRTGSFGQFKTGGTTPKAIIGLLPAPTSGGGTGQGLTDYAFTKRTSGDVTLNGTSWGNVDTGMDLTLTAVSGDTVEVAVSAWYGNEAVTASLDVVTMVSASPVNSLATGAAPDNANFGIAGLRIASTSAVVANASACIMYTLQSGDISGGAVTLRLRYRTSTAANRTLNATAAVPLHFSAKNLGAAL